MASNLSWPQCVNIKMPHLNGIRHSIAQLQDGIVSAKAIHILVRWNLYRKMVWTNFPGIGFPIIKTRCLWDSFIFAMRIPLLVVWLHSETALWILSRHLNGLVEPSFHNCELHRLKGITKINMCVGCFIHNGVRLYLQIPDRPSNNKNTFTYKRLQKQRFSLHWTILQNKIEYSCNINYVMLTSERWLGTKYIWWIYRAKIVFIIMERTQRKPWKQTYYHQYV